MRKINLILFLILQYVVNLIAQIPINDPAWILQNSSSEEFDTLLNFTTKWNSQNGNVHNGAEVRYSTNLDQSTGTTLKIKGDTLIPGVTIHNSEWHSPIGDVTYVYQGASLESQSTSYKFGYLEIYAKWPTSYYPLWPAFWLWGQGPGYYNEIDIIENGADDAFDGYTVGTNILLTLSNPIPNNPRSIHNLPFLLSSGWHKYAVDWSPDKIDWYIDDGQVRSYSDPTAVNIPQNSMFVILNFAIDPWAAFLPPDWNDTINLPSHGNKLPTHFLQNPSALNFEIDFLHYYKLDTDCFTPLTLCMSSDYDRKVKESITTNNTCTPSFNPTTTNSSYTLRATDFVMLDAGTTIDPSGTGYFAIEIMMCPQ